MRTLVVIWQGLQILSISSLLIHGHLNAFGEITTAAARSPLTRVGTQVLGRRARPAVWAQSQNRIGWFHF